MSLNADDARWYLIVQHNTTLSQAIVAAETTGSIVERIRTAWLYEYDTQPNVCHGREGPILSTTHKWLFLVNTTGILIIADNGNSSSTEYLLAHPDLCAENMAFSELDS